MERLGRMDLIQDWPSDISERYQRQLILPEIGEEGQKKLSESSILVVGAGGLGSPILLYLASAGIGKLGIMDGDTIQISNLQRQILYRTHDLGKNKVEIAQLQVSALNPHTKVISYSYRLSQDNALSIFSEYDLIIDATDNYATRRVIDDATQKLNKPFVYGAVQGFRGQVSLFNDPEHPSLRYQELFPNTEYADDNEAIGVISPIPGIIGSIQAMEAIKWILCPEKSLVGKFLTIDLLNNEYILLDL